MIPKTNPRVRWSRMGSVSTFYFFFSQLVFYTAPTPRPGPDPPGGLIPRIPEPRRGAHEASCSADDRGSPDVPPAATGGRQLLNETRWDVKPMVPSSVLKDCSVNMARAVRFPDSPCRGKLQIVGQCLGFGCDFLALIPSRSERIGIAPSGQVASTDFVSKRKESPTPTPNTHLWPSRLAWIAVLVSAHQSGVHEWWARAGAARGGPRGPHPGPDAEAGPGPPPGSPVELLEHYQGRRRHALGPAVFRIRP